MLDKQEKKLPDATENQNADTNESVTNPIEETIDKVEGQSEVIDDDLKKAPVNEGEIVAAETSEVIDEVVEGVVEKVKESDPTKVATNAKDEMKSEVLKTEAVESSEISKNQDAVDEVEKQVAAKSENLHETIEVPMEAYKLLDLVGIVTTIEELMSTHPIQAINKQIEVLKKLFNKQFGKLLAEAKTTFLAEGGNTIDFHYENPIQKQYNKVLLDYKNKRQAYYKELDTKYQENLARKQAIIERLKVLIEEGEASSMYKKFQDIQAEWRAVGPVSRDYYTDMWRTYHFHVERFYDLLHLSHDLRELDFKHNYDKKLKLVEKAEELAKGTNVQAAFNELQILHRMWKEEIGPVSRKNREEIWERFSNATKKIHDKRHDLFDALKVKYVENMKNKEAVIDAIAAFDTSANKNHNDWQKSIKKINDLRQSFFDIGRVPRSKNELIWNKFKEATKIFNQKKNIYYKEIKKEQQDNLDKKMKLVTQAELLRESEDWDSVTEVMKKIQAEWKTIGHVPRKHSDKIWNRFKEACNHFFDRLHSQKDAVDEEKMEIYKVKKAFFEELKNHAQDEGFKPDLEELKSYISKWKELGVVPKSQRYINGKFNKFLDVYFDKLSLGKTQTTMLRYRNMIDGFIEQENFRKIEDEVQFVRKKIDFISKEKQQLENNMLFFSNADESNPMIKKITSTIHKHEEELQIWTSKLQYLRSLNL